MRKRPATCSLHATIQGWGGVEDVLWIDLPCLLGFSRGIMQPPSLNLDLNFQVCSKQWDLGYDQLLELFSIPSMESRCLYLKLCHLFTIVHGLYTFSLLHGIVFPTTNLTHSTKSFILQLEQIPSTIPLSLIQYVYGTTYLKTLYVPRTSPPLVNLYPSFNVFYVLPSVSCAYHYVTPVSLFFIFLFFFRVHSYISTIC